MVFNSIDDCLKQFWDKINNRSFIAALFAPFIVCFKHRVDWAIWFLFVIIGSQLGTIVNLVNRSLFNGWSFKSALYPDSLSGSFYTFALVMMASLIAPIFIRFRNKKEPEFRSVGILFSAILIFVMILCAVFFSFSSQQFLSTSVNFSEVQSENLHIDFKQLTFFIIAILFAWYAFGLGLMGEHREMIEIDDSYVNKEDKQVKAISKGVSDVKTDGKGVEV